MNSCVWIWSESIHMNSYAWIHIPSQNLYTWIHVHEFIYSWTHIFISYMNSYIYIYTYMAPLRCDLGFVQNSRGNKPVANLRLIVYDSEFIWSFHIWIPRYIFSHMYIYINYEFTWSFHIWIHIVHDSEFIYQIIMN